MFKIEDAEMSASGFQQVITIRQSAKQELVRNVAFKMPDKISQCKK